MVNCDWQTSVFHFSHKTLKMGTNFIVDYKWPANLIGCLIRCFYIYNFSTIWQLGKGIFKFRLVVKKKNTQQWVPYTRTVYIYTVYQNDEHFRALFCPVWEGALLFPRGLNQFQIPLNTRKVVHGILLGKKWTPPTWTNVKIQLYRTVQNTAGSKHSPFKFMCVCVCLFVCVHFLLYPQILEL